MLDTNYYSIVLENLYQNIYHILMIWLTWKLPLPALNENKVKQKIYITHLKVSSFQTWQNSDKLTEKQHPNIYYIKPLMPSFEQKNILTENHCWWKKWGDQVLNSYLEWLWVKRSMAEMDVWVLSMTWYHYCVIEICICI